MAADLRSPKLLRTLQTRRQPATSASASRTGDGCMAIASPKLSAAKLPSGSSGNEVALPWPPSILSPNARAHWAAKNRAVKLYRENCAWLTKAAGLRVDWDGFVHVWITFCPPDRRHRDMDNCISSGKSLLDGVAQALGVNDSRFRLHPFLSDKVTKGGAVKVRLSKGIEE